METHVESVTAEGSSSSPPIRSVTRAWVPCCGHTKGGGDHDEEDGDDDDDGGGGRDHDDQKFIHVQRSHAMTNPPDQCFLELMPLELHRFGGNTQAHCQKSSAPL